MMLAGIALGAATAPRLGTDGRPADTRPITQPYTNTGNWMQRHDGFVARAKQGDIDFVLQGDSITDGFSTTGKTVYQKAFGGWKTVNFGIGGDTCQNVIYRFQNGELDGYKAKVFMLMIGTNNTRSYTGEEIAAGVTKIVDLIKDKQPQARILLLAIFPRAPMPRMSSARRPTWPTRSSPNSTTARTSSSSASTRNSSMPTANLLASTATTCIRTPRAIRSGPTP